MRSLRTCLPVFGLVTAALLGGCSGEPHEERSPVPTSSSRGEHDRDGPEHGGEHGAEGEESGTELALTERYDEVRKGARLLLAYDAATSSFVGTVENTTAKTLERVRVEVHLSNGRELGPSTPVNLAPGQKSEVLLPAPSSGFDGWSAHAEVGRGEHGHGEEHGGREEHDGG